MSNECRGNRSSGCNTKVSMCQFRQSRGGLLITLPSPRLMRTDKACRTVLIKSTHPFLDIAFLEYSADSFPVYVLYGRTSVCHLYLEAKGVVRSRTICNLNCSQDAGFGGAFPERRSKLMFSFTWFISSWQLHLHLPACSLSPSLTAPPNVKLSFRTNATSYVQYTVHLFCYFIPSLFSGTSPMEPLLLSQLSWVKTAPRVMMADPGTS